MAGRKRGASRRSKKRATESSPPLSPQHVSSLSLVRPLSVPVEVAYARAEWVFERHAAQLMQLPGVLCVDIGLRYQAHRPTGEVAIRVHVARKLPEAQLGGRLVPRQVEGVVVDVIERQFGLSRSELASTTVLPGPAPWIAPRHAPSSFGTATIAVRDLQGEGRACILTCAHVLAGNRSVSHLQEQPTEVVNAHGNTLGHSIPGRWLVDEAVDAALWVPLGTNHESWNLLPTARRIGRLGRKDVIERLAVWKNGAHTGWSIGQVESVRSLPIPVSMPDGTTVLVQDQVQIRAADGRRYFAQRGDSGSAVLRATADGDTEWVGVVRAVDPQGFAIACHADDIAARLDIVL